MKRSTRSGVGLALLIFCAGEGIMGNKSASLAIAQTKGISYSPLLLTTKEGSDLKANSGRFASLLKESEAHLNYQAHPLAVLDMSPHYTATGPAQVDANGKQLANDARTAYRFALAYRVSGDERYAASAQRILDVWARTLTKVATHQAQGHVNFNLPYMIIAASWVKGAHHWNSTAFDTFLTRTILPLAETDNPNNHGLWGVFMKAAIGAYLGDAAILGSARERWQSILEGAVAPDGTMTREVQRSDTNNWTGGPHKGLKGMAYTHYALLPTTLAAKIFADQGQPVWNTKAGLLLQKAFHRAAAWTLHPSTFPYYASNDGKLEGVRSATYFPILLKVYPDQEAQAVLKQGDLTMNGFFLLEMFGR